jgi:ATP-dependent protease ClpP protease subunit
MKCPIQIFNFSIRNASEDSVDIHIDGDIVDASTQELLKSWLGDETSVSFKSFRNSINAVDARVYNVYINSNGGLVTDAMAMHDFLSELESKGKTVNRIGRGIIASASTYVLMGNNSSITKNSWFMIHNVSGGVWGDVDTVENYASTLRKFNNRSRDFYAEATSMRKEDVTKMMNSETWLTAQEAVDKGFIKNITGAQNFTQKIQKDNWQFANMAVLNSYNADVLPAPSETDSSITTQLDNMKKFFQDLGTEIMNAIKGVKAPENNDHGALMASIGEAVSQTFIAQSEPMEKAVNDAVTAGNKIDFTSEAAQAAINAAVKVAVDAVTNDLSGKITALETTNEGLVAKNEELEKDIIKIKGNKSQPDKNEIVDKVYGKFN